MNRIIETLLDYAIDKQLMPPQDRCYARNRILALLKEDSYVPCEEHASYTHVSELLDTLCDRAAEKGIISKTISSYDAFDSAIMDCVMMRPSQLIEQFKRMEKKAATDMFYAFSKDSNYIRTNRIAKNICYKHDTKFGVLDITINCSKPEKDPKDIAAARNSMPNTYPTCVLCKENEGYYGNANRDGRSSIRLIPITLNDEIWYLQYSPYVYYNEHCIVLSEQHTPMKTCRATFARLLDFVEQFPHYFLGANADLPIVGGSILTHDHYQGGNYEFAMAKAKILESYDVFETAGVKAQRLYWPLSVLRLSGTDKQALISCADRVLCLWRKYSDEACNILAHTSEDHNTISVISRFRNGQFDLDLVLRNNRTSERYPLGIFHPHEKIHHIKKENIGIIEVMGLAVLPARLKNELTWIKEAILQGHTEHAEEIKIHRAWIDEIKEKYSFTPDNTEEILRKEVGDIFLEGLTHCGVFPLNETGADGWKRFINALKEES